ncbi:MAG: SDR family oxidoreductase [Thermomicrobiales bacterium]
MAASHRGRTALVTGASGGIGEELAKVFAAHGFDLVLVARTEEKLIALGEGLSAQHDIRCISIPADLALPESSAEVVEYLAKLEIDVDVLVNNAGFAAYGKFQEIDLGEQLRMIRVNIAALTELTHRLLPGMLARRRGKVLNLASTAAFLPGPLMATYYATKAYVLSFSEALNSELAGTGVTVTALCPGPTSTGFQSRAQMEESRLVRGREIMDVGTVAQAAYAGLMRGQAVIIPGASNWLTTIMPRLLPRRIVPGIVKRAQARAH